MNSADKNIISAQDLGQHNMKKYEFKKIESSPLEALDEATEPHEEAKESPTKSQVAMIESSLEKELIEKLLNKSDNLESALTSLHAQFQALHEQMTAREKAAREEGFKEGELKAQLSFKDEAEKLTERSAKTIIKLDEAIEATKNKLVAFEAEVSAIALDIAKEVIIKEVEANSAKIAALIAKELLQSLSGNLNVVIRANPLDFDYLNNLVKNKQNIKIKSDDAIVRGGVVITSESANLDGSVMARYNILKQSVLDNVRGS